jgi:hypothetical protein
MSKLKLVLAAAAGAVALVGATAADAASMLFQFDAANSSIMVTDQGIPLIYCNSCGVTASLATPFGDLTIDEGQTQTFDFATFHVSGTGLETGVEVHANLAFTQPDAPSASSDGSASYGTLYIPFVGRLTLGGLTWDPVPQITTSDGSQFTVAFQDLGGFNIGDVTDQVSITVDHVAAGVPEPGTWALMIGGLGMAGAMLRRRRQLQGAVA